MQNIKYLSKKRLVIKKDFSIGLVEQIQTLSPFSKAAVYTQQVSGRPSNGPAFGFCAIGKRLLSSSRQTGGCRMALFLHRALCTLLSVPFSEESNTYYQCNVYLDGDSSGAVPREHQKKK
jgi:hypothetical protein